MKYHILKDKELVEVGPIPYAEWFDDEYNWRLRLTEKGEVRVSTVFLGVSVGDDLFETMVSGGPIRQFRRYRTYDEAIAGHQQVCKQVFGEDCDQDKTAEQIST